MYYFEFLLNLFVETPKNLLRKNKKRNILKEEYIRQRLFIFLIFSIVMFQALRLKLVLLLTLHLTKCDKDLVSYIYLLIIAIFVVGRF